MKTKILPVCIILFYIVTPLFSQEQRVTDIQVLSAINATYNTSNQLKRDTKEDTVVKASTLVHSDSTAPVVSECTNEYHVLPSYDENGFYYILGPKDQHIIPHAYDNCPITELTYTFSYNEAENHNISAFTGYRITDSGINYLRWEIFDNAGNAVTCVTAIFFDTENTIPTAFSPNNDEYNNTWNIRFLQEYPGCIVRVFNRWGALVYESERGYPVCWDGRKRNKLVPVDTYYYIISLDNNSEPVKGYVTVLY